MTRTSLAPLQLVASAILLLFAASAVSGQFYWITPQVNNWVRLSPTARSLNGYAAYPNMHEARVGIDQDHVRGTVVIKNGAGIIWRVTAAELHNPSWTAYHTWFIRSSAIARYYGYTAGLPLFFGSASAGFDILLLNSLAARKHDVPTTALGLTSTNVDDPNSRFRQANGWCGRYNYGRDYGGGFPDFNEAIIGGVRHLGVICLRKAYAVQVDVPSYQLNYFDNMKMSSSFSANTRTRIWTSLALTAHHLQPTCSFLTDSERRAIKAVFLSMSFPIVPASRAGILGTWKRNHPLTSLTWESAWGTKPTTSYYSWMELNTVLMDQAGEFDTTIIHELAHAGGLCHLVIPADKTLRASVIAPFTCLRGTFNAQCTYANVPVTSTWEREYMTSAPMRSECCLPTVLESAPLRIAHASQRLRSLPASNGGRVANRGEGSFDYDGPGCAEGTSDVSPLSDAAWAALNAQGSDVVLTGRTRESDEAGLARGRADLVRPPAPPVRAGGRAANDGQDVDDPSAPDSESPAPGGAPPPPPTSEADQQQQQTESESESLPVRCSEVTADQLPAGLLLGDCGVLAPGASCTLELHPSFRLPPSSEPSALQLWCSDTGVRSPLPVVEQRSAGDTPGQTTEPIDEQTLALYGAGSCGVTAPEGFEHGDCMRRLAAQTRCTLTLAAHYQLLSPPESMQLACMAGTLSAYPVAKPLPPPADTPIVTADPVGSTATPAPAVPLLTLLVGVVVTGLAWRAVGA